MLAEISQKLGRDADSLKWREAEARLDPSPAQALLNLGTRAFTEARYRDADYLYRAALEQDRQLLPAYGGLIRLAFITRQTPLLRELIADADARGLPITDDPLLLWLWVVGEQGKWNSDEARAWLQAARSLAPEEPVLLAALLGMDDKEAVANAPPATASSWMVDLSLAQRAWHRGAIDETRAALERLPSEADRDPRTWWLRGALLTDSGSGEVALALLTESLRLDPFLLEAATLRGRVLQHLRRTTEAAEQLRQAALLDQWTQRALQLSQQATPDPQDVTATIELAAELGHFRWAELASQWVEQRQPNSPFSPRWREQRHSPQCRQPLALANRHVADQSNLRSQYAAAVRRATVTKADPIVAASQHIALRDVTAEMRLQFEYEFGHARERWLMETLGGGVAVLDYDLDGRPDLYFAQAGTLRSGGQTDAYRPCELFRNIGGTHFSPVPPAARAAIRGYFHGCVAGDFNEDGFAELVLCGYDRTTLLWNQGDGTWREDTAAAGLQPSTWTTSGVAVDLDQDGDLDLYQAAYCVAPLTPELRTCRTGEQWNACRPNAYPPAHDLVWENLGDGGFVERSRSAGIAEDQGYGLGVVAADFDRDGRSDVFVGNDTTPNFLHWNTGPGLSLQEGGLLAGVGVDGQGRAEACMGIACGDVNADGWSDLFVTNFHDETATLYLNLGGRIFEDRTAAAGLSHAGRGLMGWGAQFVDLDADGWLDLLFVNGQLHDTPQVPQVYRNQGGRFEDVSATAGDFFSRAVMGRAVAVGDWNGDGREDAVVSMQSGPAVVLQNVSEAGGVVRVQLIGTTAPRDAIGAVLQARIGDRKIVREVSRQGGYLAANSPVVTLGLADAAEIDELQIQWPGGRVERLERLAAGGQWIIREGQPPVAVP